MLDESIGQAVSALYTSPCKQPQEYLDNASALVSMETTVAESRVHSVHDDFLCRCFASQLTRPKHVEEFGSVIPLHSLSEGGLVVHAFQDVFSLSLVEFDPEVAFRGD